MKKKVAIIILTWNGLDYTRACLDTLKAHTSIGQDVSVIVADNGSTDGTIEYLKSLSWVTLLENGSNLGFVRGNNAAIRVADPQDDILLLNNDIEILQDGWLEEMQRVAYEQPEIGIVGCRQILPNGQFLHAGTYMPRSVWWGQQIGSLEKDVNQYGLNREVEGVVGACMYIKREVISTVGVLDEDFFSYFEDTDYCLRAREAGYRTVCAGGVTLLHHQNVTTTINQVNFSKLYLTSQKIFRQKWEKKLMSKAEATVFWHSQVGTPSGYAVSAREMILQLDVLNVDVHLAYLYGTDWMDTQKDDHRIAAMRQRPKDLSLPQVVYSSGDLFCKNSGKYRIGYTMLEVNGIPDDWVLQANAMDEVWVPSNFNRETFLNSGVRKPVYVMPLGVNSDYFNPQVRSFRASPRYTFLSIFEWGERKAAEVLLKAYHRAFSRKDDVLLLLKVMNNDPGVDVNKEIAKLNLPQDGPPVVILYNQDLPVHQMGSLYRSADCFVLPTRGEGWGMPIIEAMACGLPVIATDWSAHTDFMDGTVAYPLNVAKLIPAEAKCPYYKGFVWAQPDEDHLIELMRHVYAEREEATDKGIRASQRVLEAWNWRCAAQKIKDRLIEISGTSTT